MALTEKELEYYGLSIQKEDEPKKKRKEKAVKVDNSEKEVR